MDAPYEHNAGRPYTFASYNAERGDEPWEIIKILFYVNGLYTPADYASSGNSRYSIEMINTGIVPWLSFDQWSNHKVIIKAGVTVTEFIRLIEEAGGTIYLPKAKSLVAQ